ncbi:conjugal transfer protein TraG N-terminal domain-containing protein [Polymorphobacter megasporae]|uniref:conjugal transfer protein TraG N-terminal domain-containing protein n=1 Tax=Glacieibacterium megasporae TaxID=2835787 RepID=UPI001C1E6FDA|nr:conjugal transfer protein TraG N-terminal domain-containing protein [Polymorphobacter megasporae]UAJ12396.1 conjugal transfer protein TraG N-terminal domain-containing protein [Polymorphobacter megasporae]
MSVVEVYTIGGGEYIVNTFNAVAAWTGEGGYKSLLQVVLVMGFTMSCLVVAFNSDWRAWINWFLQGTLMYMCLMVPRVDVQVIDRINPSLAPSYVANVPIGLGLVASFTSQVGDYLTRESEVVFGMPTDMQYATNGMVYGARLIEAANAMRIDDPEFATNLDEHIRNCVFYDILLGHKTMTALGESTDLWASIGPGSPARAQKYITIDPLNATTTTDIVTCQTAYGRLSTAWTDAENRATWGLGRLLYKGPDAVVGAKLAADLGGAYTFLTGVSQDGSATFKQTLLLNAFTQSMHTMSASGGGGAVDVYAQTRAEIQTKNTYGSISAAAQKWVPILHVVLTVMFYALFPVLFPLFLLPTGGVPALKGYVTGFFYLAAWGPLFAILHMIMMLKGVDTLTGAAGGEMHQSPTLFHIGGISDAASDIAMLAGYMMASVPFLAGGIAKGAMAISSNATSFLQPSQNAAEVAANEASTGNIALGNTSLDNFSGNNRSSNNWSDVASYSSGASVFNTRGSDGFMTHGYPGAEVGDASGALSRLAVTPSLTSDLQSSFSTSATEARSRSETLSNSASSSLSTANTQASELRSALQHTVSNSNDIGADTRQSITSGLSAQRQLSQRLQESAHLSKAEADGAASELFLTGQVDGSLSTPGGGFLGARAGISGAAGGRKSSSNSSTTTGSVDAGKAREILASVAESKDFRDQRDDFNRAVRSTGDSSISAKANSASASYSQAASRSQEARTSYDQAQRFEKSASLRDSEGVSVSGNLSQRFVEYVHGEQRKLAAGGAYADGTKPWNPTRELASTPDEQAQQAFFIAGFVKAERARVAAGVEPSLVAPTPAGITRPSANAQSKIHPVSTGSVSSAGSIPSASGPDGGSLDAGRAAFAQEFVSGRQYGGRVIDRGVGDLRSATRGVSADPDKSVRSVGPKHWAGWASDATNGIVP